MPEINGKTLVCPHCNGETFHRGEAQLNTAGMTFLKLEWLNKTADLYICTQCGRIEWFHRD